MGKLLHSGPDTLSIHGQASPQWTNSQHPINIHRPKIHLIGWSSLLVFYILCVWGNMYNDISTTLISHRTVLIYWKPPKFLLFIILQTNLQKPFFSPLFSLPSNIMLQQHIALYLELFSLNGIHFKFMHIFFSYCCVILLCLEVAQWIYNSSTGGHIRHFHTWKIQIKITINITYRWCGNMFLICWIETWWDFGFAFNTVGHKNRLTNVKIALLTCGKSHLVML